MNIVSIKALEGVSLSFLIVRSPNVILKDCLDIHNIYNLQPNIDFKLPGQKTESIQKDKIPNSYKVELLNADFLY